MTNIPNIPKGDPEMPGLKPEHFLKNLPSMEARLQHALGRLSVKPEDERDGALMAVADELEIFRMHAFCAGVEVPTPIMTKAERALGTSIDH